MRGSEFAHIVQARVDKTRSVLANKAQEYATDGDRLHNFKRAAAMLRVTPEKALIGMFSKHMVSILDMVDDLDRGAHHPSSVWDEKLGDAINYLILLEGLISESATPNVGA